MNWKISALCWLFALLISAIPIVSVKAPIDSTYVNIGIGLGETVDPAWAYDTASARLIFNVYEPLLTFDGPAVDSFIPMIAKSWPGSEKSRRNIIPIDPDDPYAPHHPDYTAEIWLFEINTSIPWHDPAYGTVETEDVEYSFERGMVLDHDGGPQWMILEPLLGIMTTREYNLADDAEAELVGHMIDDAVQNNATHVWFNLKQSYAAFQQILSESWGSILDKEWTIDPSKDTGTLDNWPGFDATGYVNWRDYNDPAVPGPLMDDPEARMMGTGPYMLDYIDFVSEIYRVVYFPDYWRGWSPHPHVTAAIEKTADWSVRKAMFRAGDADTVLVPRANGPELYGASGIRFIDNLPGLVGQALFFNFAVEPRSPYVPKLGVTNKPDLFRDRNLRLALIYSINQTALIQHVYLDQAFPIGNPILEGIRYYNASKPYVNRNLALAQAYLDAAWGGQVRAQGVTIYLTYNTGGVLRQAVASQIRYVVENLLTFDPGAIVDIIPTSIPWARYISDLYANRLSSFMMGWLADFPDPHNWMQPFMHTQGDFTGHQNVEYGLNPESMNWKDFKYGGGFPYTNAQGQTVTELNNTYVDSLIEMAIQIPDANPLRQEIYEELMDIFFAEAFTVMLPQAVGRHWERDWLQGWFYNPGGLYSGGWFDYFYSLWKEDVSTVTRDLAVTVTISENSSWTKNVTVINLGETWEYFDLYEKVWVNGTLADDETVEGWLPPGGHFEKITSIQGNGNITLIAWVEISNWIRTYNMTPIPDWNPTDNFYKWTSTPPKYTLTITTTAGGTTNPAPETYSYTANSTVQVAAIPSVNYSFDHWELDSINVGSANPYTVLMDKDHTLKAIFSPIPKPPVGGYSIQTEGYTTANPITPYIALITILTIGFTTIRHKQKHLKKYQETTNKYVKNHAKLTSHNTQNNNRNKNKTQNPNR